MRTHQEKEAAWKALRGLFRGAPKAFSAGTQASRQQVAARVANRPSSLQRLMQGLEDTGAQYTPDVMTFRPSIIARARKLQRARKVTPALAEQFNRGTAEKFKRDARAEAAALGMREVRFK